MPAVATKKARKPRRLSRTHKPDYLSIGQWQTELRRQFGRDLPVKMRNLGTQPVFSEFAVTHADTARTYRVAVRGEELRAAWRAVRSAVRAEQVRLRDLGCDPGPVDGVPGKRTWEALQCEAGHLVGR